MLVVLTVKSVVAPLLAVSALIAALSGCGPTCPNQPTGCAASTTLLIPLPSGSPEVYDVALTFRTGEKQETDRCLAILPPPDDWTAGLPASCLRNSASVSVQRDLDVDCSVSYPEGASCSVNARGFVLSVRRAGRVDGVELRLTRAGTPFAPFALEPVYETFHPDGPDCPGACDVSSTVVSFEALVEPVSG